MGIKASRLLSSTLVFFTLAVGLSAAAHAETKKHHALSLVGEPKYKADFKHFDYVNPDAPKGGRVRVSAMGTFETLNQFAAIQGAPANGLGLIYDQLMATSYEEPSTEYGQLAEYVSRPDDFSSVTFKLRKNARWHDGKPITPEDVIFSFQSIIKVHPRQAQYYRNVKEVKKTGENEVTFSFNVKNNRELPQIVGQLTIIPKHYWTGIGKDGKKRDLNKTTLEVPLGSGPYKISNVQPGKVIIYERVKDYWGKDLAVSKGKNNFDQIQYYYFLDQGVAFEAFKSGKIDFFDVRSSKRWATEFKFSALDSGKVKRYVVPEKSVNYMQAFVFNIRRSKFSDARLRKAFDLVFDFEWSNKNLFYNQYSRLSSYFDNSELAAKGLPQGRELEILNEIKSEIPAEVFSKEYKSPVNSSSREFRRNLRKALKLLKDAGWVIENKRLVNSKTKKPLTAEFLIVQPTFKRVVLPYIENLKRLGIQASVIQVDLSQYKRRLDNFDYDIVVASFPQSFSPGNEQRYFWGSKSADQPGTYNRIGIKNPTIDKLIDKIIFAKDRPELVAATRALDRVLLWNHYVVPQWYASYQRIAFWDTFGHPKTLNLLAYDCVQDCLKKAVADKNKILTLDAAFLQTWWYDANKAKK